MNKDLIYCTKELVIKKHPFFASELSKAKIEYRDNLKYHTAATDGSDIYIDPNYFASLNDDERVFLIAHELLHIKFQHALRLIDKNGNKRDQDTWNYVCDAIINANLERDGFIIKEGYVNMPEAIEYAAEELYDKLMKEKEKNPDLKFCSASDKNGDSSPFGDDHSMWEEAFEKILSENESNNEQSKSSSDDKKKEGLKKLEKILNYDYDEKGDFSKNRDERKKEALKELEKLKNEMLKKTQEQSSNSINVGSVGNAKNSIDWRLLLRREIEKSEFYWTQRRSVAENNFAYRLVENEEDDEAETEVMIDVSGSVDINLVKGFLRMLKPILKESKLKVGCFNERFWGMTLIKSNHDIDNFIIPAGARGNSAWTEDWDLAVRSFTKKREINKIVFTDGWPEPGTMPKNDLKNENIIWLVYGNKNFRPCCGKVIMLTKSQLEQIHSVKTETKGIGRK